MPATRSTRINAEGASTRAGSYRREGLRARRGLATLAARDGKRGRHSDEGVVRGRHDIRWCGERGAGGGAFVPVRGARGSPRKKAARASGGVAPRAAARARRGRGSAGPRAKLTSAEDPDSGPGLGVGVRVMDAAARGGVWHRAAPALGADDPRDVGSPERFRLLQRRRLFGFREKNERNYRSFASSRPRPRAARRRTRPRHPMPAEWDRGDRRSTSSRAAPHRARETSHLRASALRSAAPFNIRRRVAGTRLRTRTFKPGRSERRRDSPR